MFVRYHAAGVSLAALASFAVASAAIAQQRSPDLEASESSASSGAAAATDDIIVTAQKRDERLQDVPIAISAISGDSMQRRNLANLGDFAVTVPSVNIQTRRGSGIVTIRGIGFDIGTAGADPGVAIHTDGVYIARPAATLAGFYDLERVEVARGPQGTLYGRNATGGAINLISRSPTDIPEGYVDLSYGNYDALAVEGAFGGPVISDKVLARLSFRVDNRDGYGTNLFNGQDINDLKTRAFRAQVKFQPADNFTITLRGDFFREQDSNGVPAYSGTVNPCSFTVGTRRCGIAFGGIFSTDPQNAVHDFQATNNRKYYALSATSELDLGGLTVRSISAYRHTMYRLAYDFDNTSSPTGGDFGRYEKANQYSQELQFIGKIGRLSYIGGLYYFREHNPVSGFANIANPDFPSPDVILQNGTLISNSYAGYGELSYELTEQLTLVAGARYTIEKKKIEDEFSRTSTTAIRFGPDRQATFKSFSPKISLNFKPSDDVLLYASYQKGFKSGGFSAGALTPEFKPEIIASYETGLKATWLGGALRTNVSAFYYDYSNLQVGRVSGPVNIVTNAASARIKGIEGEITLRPIRGFTIETNVSIVDAKFKSYETADPNRPALGMLDLSGNRLSGSAPFTAFVAPQYQMDLGEGTLTLRGEYSWSDAFYLDSFNTGYMRAPGYDRINAFLTYAKDRFQVTAFVRNLSKQDQIGGGTISSGLIGAPIVINYYPPRTYGIRFVRNF